MSSQRFVRRLGLDARAAVMVQWFVRMVAGMVTFEVIQHVLAPIFGVTILSPSQLIDRFLAWNHTFPTPGVPSSGPSPLMNPTPGATQFIHVEILISLLAWAITLWIIVCLVAALWSWLEYGLAGPERTAAIDRGDR